MKRILFIIISLVAALAAQAQATEYMRIYIDKDCYLAGEDLWVKVSVTDSLHRASTLSKVAYIEVSDTRQMHAQGMIALENGTGWGRIRFPHTMHSGTYLLTAYTRYMRNRPERFLTKHIGVLNAGMASEEDKVEVLDSLSVSRQALAVSPWRLSADRPVYSSRSRVTLTLPELPAGVGELTLSVVRRDGFGMPEEDTQIPQSDSRAAEAKRFIAESEGHIVTGRLVGAPSDSVDARLSCVGKDIRIFDGQWQPDGTYRFYTTEIADRQDIVVSSLPPRGKPAGRLEVVSPFAGALPRNLPTLRLFCNEEALTERSIGAQLHHLLPADSARKRTMLSQLHDFTPSISYNLDEYVRFPTVRETFTEFVMGIRVSKSEGETVIRMLQEDVKRYSAIRALVLIDGVPIENHEAVLNYDARLLHHIHQYSGRYTFGGNTYDGIVSMITHRGTLPDLRLDDNSQLFSYEFPQYRPGFEAPVYDSAERVQSRVPDFRHTLYWNPDVATVTGAVSFYTSDLKGDYVVTLQGVTATGEPLKVQSEFAVR